MNPLFESVKISLDDLRSNLLSSVTKISKDLEIVKKLKLAQEFIMSNTWKNIEPTSNGHDVIYEYFSHIFNDRRVMITDDGCITHDNKNLYQDLSSEEKNFVNSVDSKKEYGVFNLGRLYAMYIGSTVVIDTIAVIDDRYYFPENTYCSITTTNKHTGVFTGYIESYSYDSSTKSYKGKITGIFLYQDNEEYETIVKTKQYIGTQCTLTILSIPSTSVSY